MCVSIYVHVYVLSHSVQAFSHVWFFVTPWMVIRQVPLSMEFSSLECWSQLSFPTQGDLPNPGIKPTIPALPGGFFTTEPSERKDSFFLFSFFFFK